MPVYLHDIELARYFLLINETRSWNVEISIKITPEAVCLVHSVLSLFCHLITVKFFEMFTSSLRFGQVPMSSAKQTLDKCQCHLLNITPTGT